MTGIFHSVAESLQVFVNPCLDQCLLVLTARIFCPYAYWQFGDPLALCHLVSSRFLLVSCVVCLSVSFPKGPGFSSVFPQHRRYLATNTNSSISSLFLGVTTWTRIFTAKLAAWPWSWEKLSKAAAADTKAQIVHGHLHFSPRILHQNDPHSKSWQSVHRANWNNN